MIAQAQIRPVPCCLVPSVIRWRRIISHDMIVEPLAIDVALVVIPPEPRGRFG
jgi:hypothetical protein